MKRLLLILTLLSLAACRRADESVIRPMLVVEGWIEEGGTPYVYLTTSMNPSLRSDISSDLKDHIVTTARVTLSDGEEEVVLVGLYSKRYYPPFVYTTGRMTGKAGKTYTLTVDADEFHATASVTIPPSRELESLEVIPYGDIPSAHLIQAHFKNNPDESNYYMSFVKIEKTDSTYVPVELSLVDGALAGKEVSVPLRPSVSTSRQVARSWFEDGERVWVKFRTMDREMHRIWKHIGEQHGLSSIPIFVLDENLPGNVKGAQGYFAGYGCTDYQVDIPKK